MRYDAAHGSEPGEHLRPMASLDPVNYRVRPQQASSISQSAVTFQRAAISLIERKGE